MMKIRDYLEENHQKLADIVSVFSYLVAIPATIAGIWFTYYSIENTSDVVERQLTEQKKATSIIVVGDFLSGLTDKIIDKQKENKDFDKVTIIRTQLLVDTLHFPDLIAQVIVFLGVNEFGDLFDSTRRPEDKFIELANVDLSDTYLGNINLTHPNIYCANLSGASLHRSYFIDSEFSYSSLESSKLIETNFEKANFQWTNFRDSYIFGASFKDATVRFSDLRGIRVYEDSAIKREQEAEEIADILLQAKSLYGSLLDLDIRKNILEREGESDC